MKRTIIFGLLLLVINSLLPAIASGQETTIFGPRTFAKEKGKPRFVEDSFLIEDVVGIFTLQVQNGVSGDRHSRVSGATILLNGVEVADHKDINKQVESTQIPIFPVQGENSIAVKLKGSPRGFITVSVIFSPPIERTITLPAANPDGIFVSEPTLVTITAEIDPDPALIASEVSLLRLDEYNQLIDILGDLHDDGLNGDALADDYIFTLQTTFTEPDPTEIRLLVSAAYTTPYTLALSGIFTVDAVEPITEEDFQIIVDTEEAAAQYFENLKQTHSDDVARQMTADWLKTQAGVQDAGISIDNDTIWILFASGLEGGIITHPLGTRGSSPSDPIDPIVTPGISKAMVMAAFFDEFSISGGDESDHIAQKISQIWGPTPTIKNAAVTVSLMKTLSQYGVVSITSHGCISKKGQVQIFTREKATLLNRPLHIFDLMTGRIAIVNGYYVIRPKFITRYARRHLYEESLIYVGACHSKGNHTMANAFLNRGAYTYFGYDNIVHSDFAFDIGTRLFNHLVDDQMTTGDAFNALPNRIDPTWPHAEFLMNGSNDLVLLPVPVIEVIYPADGAIIIEPRPAIKAKVYRPGYETDPDVPNIDLSSITLTLTDYKNHDVSGTLTFEPNEDAPAITVTFVPDSDLQADDPKTPDIDEGEYTVTVDAKDINGVAAEQKVWVFFVRMAEHFAGKIGYKEIKVAYIRHGKYKGGTDTPWATVWANAVANYNAASWVPRYEYANVQYYGQKRHEWNPGYTKRDRRTAVIVAVRITFIYDLKNLPGGWDSQYVSSAYLLTSTGGGMDEDANAMVVTPPGISHPWPIKTGWKIKGFEHYFGNENFEITYTASTYDDPASIEPKDPPVEKTYDKGGCGGEDGWIYFKGFAPAP